MSDTSVSSTHQHSAHIRENLLHSGFYLGDQDLVHHVHWAPNGRKDSLFINKPLQSHTSSSDNATELTTLSTVVRIMDNNFWLTSDVGWRAPTSITAHLHDAKATCVGVAPRSGPFHADFLIAAQNATNLQQQIATPDFNLRYGFACTGEGESTQFKFRHVLFEKINGDNADDEFIQRTYDLDDWPVHSEGARNALDDMKSTHHAIPLAAYDVDDQLIPPTSYRQQLQGALVEIHFNLSHSAFKGKDMYTADIHSIRVITVPPSTATTKKCPLILCL
ncbi:hypothetical protein BU15DRAFT_80809 [Melanogaster broomeanus]|nr:hypothetical protein BU15DRAFT_80809 [Melanogaster broomeanus]